MTPRRDAATARAAKAAHTSMATSVTSQVRRTKPATSCVKRGAIIAGLASRRSKPRATRDRRALLRALASQRGRGNASATAPRRAAPTGKLTNWAAAVRMMGRDVASQSTIGRYQILDRLAVGGMAELFKATLTGRPRLREAGRDQEDPAAPRDRPARSSRCSSTRRGSRRSSITATSSRCSSSAPMPTRRTSRCSSSMASTCSRCSASARARRSGCRPSSRR